MSKAFVVACLVSVMFASVAVAQTTPPAPNPNQGAFDQLSPGNQKIAQALFDAEQSNSTSTTTKPLSLDDIAAMKQDGKGWGEIFKKMKAQGLVQAKNLGQVVSQANHTARSSANGTVITSGSGRTYVAGAKTKPELGSTRDGQNGSDHQPQFSGDQGSLSSGAGTAHSSAGSHVGRGRN